MVQRDVTMMVASGILDRHPNLKILVSEGGANRVPFVADRMTEAYRQHGVWVGPKLSRPPARSSMSRCTPRFSMIGRPCWAAQQSATGTWYGAPTTRTSRARSVTPRRRYTSCSTTWMRARGTGSAAGLRTISSRRRTAGTRLSRSPISGRAVQSRPMSPGHFHEKKAGLAGWVLRLCLQSATQVLHRTPQLRIVDRGGRRRGVPPKQGCLAWDRQGSAVLRWCGNGGSCFLTPCS